MRTLHPTNFIWIPAFAGMTFDSVCHSARSEKPTASFCTEKKNPASFYTEQKKILRHSARSEAELQNLMSKQENLISRDLEDSATARRMTIFFNKKVDALKSAYPPYKSNPFVIARRYDEAISAIQTNFMPRQNGVVRTLHPTNLKIINRYRYLIWIPAFAGMTFDVVRHSNCSSFLRKQESIQTIHCNKVNSSVRL